MASDLPSSSSDSAGTPATRRKLGIWMSIALVTGSMIGSGVFLLPASLAPFGWNAVAGWIITIAGALCLAHVLARLTAAADGPIGPAELVERSFGRYLATLDLTEDEARIAELREQLRRDLALAIERRA